MANDWDGQTTASGRVHEGSVNPATSAVETKAYVYPHPRLVDTLGNLLDGVSDCPSSSHRKIWLVGPSISNGRMTENDNRLYDSLRAQDTLGCSIRVITIDSIKCSVRNTLTGSDIAAELITLPAGTLHSKTLIVDAESTDVRGDNPAQRQFVWTGSTNHTEGIWTSANSNIRVDDHDVARKYISNFTAIWNSNNRSAITCVS